MRSSQPIPYIDTHCHLADSRLNGYLEEIRHKGTQAGIQYFLMAGVGPEDWQSQIEIVERDVVPGALCSFGLHPCWVAQHTEVESHQALDQLSRLLPRAHSFGEMGLDFRSPYASPEQRALQVDVFEQQLEFSKTLSLPVVLHVVRAHPEALKILEVWGLGSGLGWVHSFSGTKMQMHSYLQLGLSISIGTAVCHPNNRALHEAVKELPLEHLLIETDFPDQKPFGWREDLNDPSSLLWVARAVAEIKGISAEQVLDTNTQNLRQMGLRI